NPRQSEAATGSPPVLLPGAGLHDHADAAVRPGAATRGSPPPSYPSRGSRPADATHRPVEVLQEPIRSLRPKGRPMPPGIPRSALDAAPTRAGRRPALRDQVAQARLFGDAAQR